MRNETYLDEPLWEEFKKEARQRRRNPVRLVTEYMRECLETWEYERVFEEIKRDTQTSGYTKEDAVELVRQFRAEKRQRADS